MTRMRRYVIGFGGSLVVGFILFYFLGGKTVEVTKPAEANVEKVVMREDGDLPYQEKLKNPPEEIRALYVTNWVAATPRLFEPIVKLAGGSRVNALVIDIKDYSGYVGFNTDNKEVVSYAARERRIKHLNKLIADSHKRGIYLIGRVAVFQDPRLAKARPDWAVKNSQGNTWEDRHGLSWVDPANEEYWDYIVGIAKEVSDRGFDEVNFDYVRFPTDGVGVNSLTYPIWNKEEKGKEEVIKEFFIYLRENLPGVVISADVFGQTTVVNDDQGIGQILEDAYEYFDYVYPMVYPSHFSNGFNGYKNPAEEPFGVIKYSMQSAVNKLIIYEQNKLATTTPLTVEELKGLKQKIRPWLQDFDLGAIYTVEMVKDQMRAVNEAGLGDNWLVWNPNNRYREEIFD